MARCGLITVYIAEVTGVVHMIEPRGEGWGLLSTANVAGIVHTVTNSPGGKHSILLLVCTVSYATDVTGVVQNT